MHFFTITIFFYSISSTVPFLINSVNVLCLNFYGLDDNVFGATIYVSDYFIRGRKRNFLLYVKEYLTGVWHHQLPAARDVTI